MNRWTILRASFMMLFLFCVLAAFAYLIYKTSGKDFSITIVHTNDLHAQFAEVDIQGGICKNKKRCFGGMPRLINVFTELKKGHNVITLDAGDKIGFSLFLQKYKWEDIRHIDKLKYDVVTVGEEDINKLIENTNLGPILFNSPIVLSNIRTFTPSRSLYNTSRILQVAGKYIGIVGVINRHLDMYVTFENSDILNELDAIRKEIKVLKQSAPIWTVIVLSHCGYKKDIELAKNVPKEVSVIVGGHSHTILMSDEDENTVPYLIEGVYPKVVETMGRKVLIVTAGYYGLFIGNISVTYNNRGQVKEFSGKPIFINNSIKEDEKVKAEMKPFMDGLAGMVNETIGETTVGFYYKYCFLRECVYGNLFTDAMMDYVVNKNDKKCKPDLALLTPHKFVSNILIGPISTADIYFATRPKGKLKCAKIAGATIKEAILRGFNTTLDMKFTRQVLQQSGLKVIMNFETDKLLVTFKNNDKLFPNVEYKVLLPESMTEGQDGFNMLINSSPIATYDHINPMLIDFIKKMKTITKSRDDRIELIGDPAIEEITLMEQHNKKLKKMFGD